jgi:hypothetical protein
MSLILPQLSAQENQFYMNELRLIPFIETLVCGIAQVVKVKIFPLQA